LSPSPPCIPLSLEGEGGEFSKRGFAPLRRPLVSLSFKGKGKELSRRDFVPLKLPVSTFRGFASL